MSPKKHIVTAQDGHAENKQPSLTRVNTNKPDQPENLERPSWKWGVKDEEQVDRQSVQVGPPSKEIKLQKGPEATGNLSAGGGLRMRGQDAGDQTTTSVDWIQKTHQEGRSLAQHPTHPYLLHNLSRSGPN